MCPPKAGHPLNTALASLWPVIYLLLVGHGHLPTATEGDEGWQEATTHLLSARQLHPCPQHTHGKL